MVNIINALFLVVLALVAQWHVHAQVLVPAWPLAVKNPYLNTWYFGGSKPATLNNVWPNLWNGSITGWFSGVQVDGVPYRIMGDDSVPPSNASTQLSVQITPTQTIVSVQTGPVNITMNFLSPITATDLTRQSLPFSYFSVTAASLDGSPHTVKVYSDISAEWISGDDTLIAKSTQDIESDFVILETSLQTPQSFTEVNQHTQDGTSIYALKNGAGVQYGVGVDDVVRNFAMNSTGLQDNIDQNISAHAINTPFDVWGISADLGSVTTTSSPLVYAIGLIRDPAIQFTTLSGNAQLRSSYYRMNFTTPHDMVSFFLNDFNNAMSASKQLDSQILNDATKVSSSYGDLLSLVARQAMSAIEITVSKNADGSFNSSDVMAFMKDMGNVGAGVNAVDVLYAAFPMYLYLNPALGGYLLQPLLVAQDTTSYTQPYAAQGLDANYPNATIENVSHNFGIEQSGNMIIMLLAHLQATGDGSLVNQHYTLIKGWADYVVQNSLNPGPQQASHSDAISAVNQTNLALKGIIGIGAMAKISRFVGMNSDASSYASTAQSYIGQWQNLTISQDKTRLLTSFGSDSSAGLIYNLYADKLLQLGLVPSSVYDLQTSYYITQLASSKLGIPLDTKNPTYTRADWMMFAAAAVTDSSLQSSLIALVHSYAFTAPTMNTPISPLYDPTTGNSPGGANRSVP
ncbi:DUF1793-domain-containing protein [Schizopora paradoxa]|uniref:DUF1793-domain-containing protein n=1 Tax=Schizopora paradoxa TaxID=27342 RepID=A0A0H2R870_9AGAM|nr:DUF1793-domain-containing protein [Schizopora paradoxa]